MQKYCFTLYSLLFCLASTTSLLKTIYPQPLWASFGWRRRVASVGGAMLTLAHWLKTYGISLIFWLMSKLCNRTIDWRKNRGTDFLQLFQPNGNVHIGVSWQEIMAKPYNYTMSDVPLLNTTVMSHNDGQRIALLTKLFCMSKVVTFSGRFWIFGKN